MNILLLRGLAREARHWGDFVGLLEAHPQVGQVLCLDLPGVGTQLKHSTPAKVSTIVEEVRSRWLNAKEGIDGPWAVLGISFGGMIGLDWCYRHDADFKGVIIGNSSALNLGMPHERMTPQAMKHVLKSNLEKNPFEREKLVLQIVSNDAKKRAKVEKAWGTIAKESPIRRGTFMRQLIAAAAYRCPDSCPVPALILASTADRFVGVRCSERLAMRIGGRLEYHPTAGHAITLDAPEWVAEKTSTWLSEIS